MNHVKEIVLFRLKDSVDEADFLQAAQTTFDLLADYDGYVDRELTVSDDGLWIDVVTWSNLETAMSAAEQIMQDKVGQRFGSFIDPDSIQMNHTHPRLIGHAKSGESS